jgi:hydrogenase/urease accessory protein HupE
MCAMLSLAAAVVLWPCAAQAHEQDVVVSTVEIADAEPRVVWRVELPIHMDEAQLRARADDLGRAVATTARVIPEGEEPLSVAIGSVEPRFAPGTRQIVAVVQTLTFAGPRAFARVTLHAARPPGTAGNQALMTVRWAGQSRRFARTMPADIVVERGRLFPSAAATFGEFLLWGARHIVAGWDHLAFLFCLILASRRPRQLLVMVTAFTVGHSATLIAAALGALRVSPRLAEIGIALSVVYVALENIARGEKPARNRWALAAGFGLVHGLGLASELATRLDDAGPRLVAAVLAFNLGVELGQLAVGAAMFAVLAWVRRTTPRPLVRAASLPIVLLGVYWLIARTVTP